MDKSDNILIIDDEVQIRRLLEITLSSHDYKISEAATGKEGLISAATSHPELIILDLGLPDIGWHGDPEKAERVVSEANNHSFGEKLRG